MEKKSFSRHASQWLCLAVFLLPNMSSGDDRGVRLPSLGRILPLGGRAGTDVAVSLLGDMLSNAQALEFDCADLSFQLRKADAGQIEGLIRIAAGAAPGPHLFRAKTEDGYTNAMMFTVGQLPPVDEKEPNESIRKAQAVSLPCEIYGSMQKVDVDFYSFQVKAGDRWTFEVRAAQYGSTFESQLYLRDENGKELAFNDDRGDYDVNSMIEHTFSKSGTYYVQVDVFRNVRGWDFAKNCGYILRISQLPRIIRISPLGGRAGTSAKVHVTGVSFEGLERVFLYPTRRAEYSTLSVPWTLPVRFTEDYPVFTSMPRVEARITQRSKDALDVEFSVPSQPVGVWSLIVQTKTGVSDPVLYEVDEARQISEFEPNDLPKDAQKLRSDGEALVVDGQLQARNSSEVAQDIDYYVIDARKGVPFHIFTLAYQLLAPRIDTVLRLFNPDGKLLAESDDLTAGRGFFMGSVDSNLYYVPDRDGKLCISVSDRLGRGGADFNYRLHVRVDEPGFHLIVSPQFGTSLVSNSNFTAVRGGEANLIVSFIRMPPKTYPDHPEAAALASPAGTVMEGEVRVWVEGLPPGITAQELRFRADEIAQPGEGVMEIPKRLLALRVADSVTVGVYPVRVMGEVVGKERIKVQGLAFDTIGGLMGEYNYFHRPAAGTALSVVEPGALTLQLKQETIRIAQGGSAIIDLENSLARTERQLPSIQLLNLPEGLNYDLHPAENGDVSIELRASTQLPVKPINDVYVEATLGHRRISSRPFVVSVSPKEMGH